MKAWLCENPTGVDALAWKTLPDTAPGPGELRVAIKAASLNFPDLLMVQNKYQVKPPLPFIPGAEYAGWVEAVGEGVTGFKVGERVAALSGTGGFATHINVTAASVMHLPAEFSFEDAAAFVCTYATSHHALIDRAALAPGETVLVLGAAGGVGTSAIQIAKAAGARVIAAASSAEKCARCIEIGADAVIDYGNADVRLELKALTRGLGPDVVYDPVGGALAEPVFRSLAWRGRYLVIGFAQGTIPALPLNLALLKEASILGVYWGEFAKREPLKNAAALQQLVQWYLKGSIKPVLDRVLPMEQLPEAFARMGSRQVCGKLVLVNS